VTAAPVFAGVTNREVVYAGAPASTKTFVGRASEPAEVEDAPKPAPRFNPTPRYVVNPPFTAPVNFNDTDQRRGDLGAREQVMAIERQKLDASILEHREALARLDRDRGTIEAKERDVHARLAALDAKEQQVQRDASIIDEKSRQVAQIEAS